MTVISKSKDSKRVEVIIDKRTFHAHQVSGNEYQILLGFDAKKQPVYKSIYL